MLQPSGPVLPHNTLSCAVLAPALQAVRLPLLNASHADCLHKVARPRVATDLLKDPRSAIIGTPSKGVTGGTQVKVHA